MSKATSTADDHNLPNDFMITPFEPIITYDHMTEQTQSRYVNLKNNRATNPTLHLVIEVSLIATLFVLTIIAGL